MKRRLLEAPLIIALAFMVGACWETVPKGHTNTYTHVDVDRAVESALEMNRIPRPFDDCVLQYEKRVRGSESFDLGGSYSHGHYWGGFGGYGGYRDGYRVDQRAAILCRPVRMERIPTGGSHHD